MHKVLVYGQVYSYWHLRCNECQLQNKIIILISRLTFKVAWDQLAALVAQGTQDHGDKLGKMAIAESQRGEGLQDLMAPRGQQEILESLVDPDRRDQSDQRGRQGPKEAR